MMKTQNKLRHSCSYLTVQKALSCLGFMVVSAAVVANAYAVSAETNANHPQQAEQTNPMQTTMPPEFQDTKKWQAFQSLWQELNTLAKPGSGTTPPEASQFITVKPQTSRFQPALTGYTERAYYQAISPEQAQRLQARLNALFPDAPASLEVRLLIRLTELRIQEMSLPHRFTHDYTISKDEIMTRMGPPMTLNTVSPTLYLVNAIDRIQLRTQTLRELRDKGAVSDKLYQQTLQALIKDAQLALFLDALTFPYMSAQSKFRSDLSTDKAEFGMFPPNQLHIQPQDLVQPYTDEQTRKTDIQNIDVWSRAVELSYNRQLGHALSSEVKTEQEPISREDANEQLQLVMQKLAQLRLALERIEPLIAELER